jgi:hypothetical protein
MIGSMSHCRFLPVAIAKLEDLDDRDVAQALDITVPAAA